MSPTKLQLAQRKLQATGVPLLLRVTYYLRICCAALVDQGVHYTTLVQTLAHHNPNWLETCTVTEAGLLQSSDRTINKILKPFKSLHQAPSIAISSSAIAA